MNRYKHARWLGAGVLTSIVVAALSACAIDRYTLPPPLSVDALPGARAQVFRLADAPETTPVPASVCSTSAGYCSVPADTPAGLRCTCEAPDGSYVYAGRTGGIPPMPEWADPSKKRP